MTFLEERPVTAPLKHRDCVSAKFSLGTSESGDFWRVEEQVPWPPPGQAAPWNLHEFVLRALFPCRVSTKSKVEEVVVGDEFYPAQLALVNFGGSGVRGVVCTR